MRGLGHRTGPGRSEVRTSTPPVANAILDLADSVAALGGRWLNVVPNASFSPQPTPYGTTPALAMTTPDTKCAPDALATAEILNAGVPRETESKGGHS